MSRWVIRVASWVVPAAERPQWREEWSAEMAAVRRGRGRIAAVRLILGAGRDALSVRQTRPRTIARGGPLQGLMQDLRDARRSILGAPGFALGVVGSLALGIGSVTTGFSVVNTAIFKAPDGIARPHEVIGIRIQRIISGIPQSVAGATVRAGGNATTPQVYEQLRSAMPSLAGVAAFRSTSLVVGLPGEPDSVPATLVTGNYFPLLGVRPVLGRLILPDDETRPVAVLSHAAWARYFGGDPEAVGRTLKINGRPVEIIGVAQPEFTGTRVEIEADSAAYVWVPLQVGEAAAGASDRQPATVYVELLGRLQPGSTRREALNQATVFAARFGTASSPVTARIVGLAERPGSASDVVAFMAVPAIVLLLACVNAANLLTARATRRIRDTALRLAIGATRWRIVRELLVESFLLALAAAAGGIALTTGGLALARHYAPLLVHVDLAVFGFALATAALTAFAFGVGPGIAAASHAADLVSRVARRPTSRTRTVLVGLQAALSLALIATGWQFTNTVRLMARNDGLTHADRLIIATADVERLGWSPSEISAYFDRLDERLRRVPGVVDVSESCACNVWGSWTSVEQGGGVRFTRPGDDGTEHRSTLAMYAGGDIFSALELPLVEGRAFRSDDHQAPLQSVIVNEAFAKSVLGGNAVGQTIQIHPPVDGGGDPRAAVVVGVVGTAPVRRTDSLPMLFYPTPLTTLGKRQLFVRFDRDATDAVALVRAAIREVHADVPRAQVATAEQARWERNSVRQVVAGAVSLLGIVALVLAAGGLYGVVAFAVTSRRHEIAVRMAVGAEPRRVVRMIVRQALVPVLIGSTVGAFATVALAALIRSRLYGTSPLDAVATGGAFALLLSVLFVAAALPARRATRIDPLQVLRTE